MRAKEFKPELFEGARCREVRHVVSSLAAAAVDLCTAYLKDTRLASGMSNVAPSCGGLTGANVENTWNEIVVVAAMALFCRLGKVCRTRAVHFDKYCV